MSFNTDNPEVTQQDLDLIACITFAISPNVFYVGGKNDSGRPFDSLFREAEKKITVEQAKCVFAALRHLDVLKPLDPNRDLINELQDRLFAKKE